MRPQSPHHAVPAERYRTIVLAQGLGSTIVWEEPVDTWPAPPFAAVAIDDHSEIGPGWALLVRHLERRLRRGGVAPHHRPPLLATGAGELGIVLPARAPRWAHTAARATSRLALRRCEICLRCPTLLGSVDLAGTRETLRLCHWHHERLAVIRSSGGVRVEAWRVVRYGVGALRAMLLGVRLSPTGVEAALRQVAAATVVDEDLGWIPPDLVVHALARVAPATLAGVSADALLPLLSDADEDLRQMALLALAQVRGAAVHAGPSAVATPAAPSPAMLSPAMPHPATEAVEPDALALGAPTGAHAQGGADSEATPPPLPRPRRPISAWLVETESESRYVLARDADLTWWLGGDNRASIRSAAIPAGRLYQVECPTPWPPEPGESMIVIARHTLNAWDPARLPGGGKRTTAVVAIAMLTPSDSEQAPDGSPFADGAPSSGETETSPRGLPIDGSLVDLSSLGEVHGPVPCAEEGA